MIVKILFTLLLHTTFWVRFACLQTTRSWSTIAAPSWYQSWTTSDTCRNAVPTRYKGSAENHMNLSRAWIINFLLCLVSFRKSTSMMIYCVLIIRNESISFRNSWPYTCSIYGTSIGFEFETFLNYWGEANNNFLKQCFAEVFIHFVNLPQDFWI